jgi:hypothetical protein
MSTNYIGFSGQQKPLIQRANVQAGACIQFALDTAMFQTDVFLRAMKTYFGTSSKNQSAVMAVLNSMVLAVRQGTYDLVMAGASGSTLAAAETIGSAMGGRAKGKGTDGSTVYHVPYIKTSQDEAAKGTKNLVSIMPSFFTLPYKGKDMDTQVETIIHELSHHAANTDDEEVNGKDCYGYEGVKRAVRAGKAINNAENYGYFICSFQNFA